MQRIFFMIGGSLLSQGVFKFLWDDICFWNAPFKKVDMDLAQALLVDVNDLWSVALFLSLSFLPLNFMNFRFTYGILFVILSYCLKYLFFQAILGIKIWWPYFTWFYVLWFGCFESKMLGNTFLSFFHIDW